MGKLDWFFSERAKGLKASEIRELLKLTQQPDIISCAGGLPGPEAFPAEHIKQITADILTSKDCSDALQYGPTEGLTKLRDALADRMRTTRKIDTTGRDLILTTGSQQALDLMSKVLIDPDDIVVVGAPTYLGGVSAFKAFQAKIESVPLDDEGEQIDILTEKIRRIHRHGGNLKFMYVLPTFHNPAGVTMGEKRRKAILDIACQYDMMILEDDPYFDLRYEGEHVMPIKSLDTEGRVIYVGTFSKILVPGFRLGWVVAQEDTLHKIIIAKQSTDLCSNQFCQYIAYEYLNRGLVDPHIQEIRRIYGEKRKVMLKAIEENFPDCVRWSKPLGGMFIWAQMPEGVDTREMFKEAIKERVAYVTGTAFFANGGGCNCMRLNFTHSTHEKIVQGIKRLSATMRNEIERVKTKPSYPPPPSGP